MNGNSPEYNEGGPLEIIRDTVKEIRSNIRRLRLGHAIIDLEACHQAYPTCESPAAQNIGQFVASLYVEEFVEGHAHWQYSLRPIESLHSVVHRSDLVYELSQDQGHVTLRTETLGVSAQTRACLYGEQASASGLIDPRLISVTKGLTALTRKKHSL